MGGIGGEVLGRTPDEAWMKFEKEVRPELEDRFGLFLEAPLTREAAFGRMWQDPTSTGGSLTIIFQSEWTVLRVTLLVSRCGPPAQKNQPLFIHLIGVYVNVGSMPSGL
jgi:hypothetical protein